MDDLPAIPTRPVWLVVQEESAGNVADWHKFESEQPALIHLRQLKDSGVEAKLIQRRWPVSDRTLPTERQNRALWDFMHHTLVLIRHMSWYGKSQQIAELTDILEIMPLHLTSAKLWDWNYFEFELRAFAEKHGEGIRLARLLHEIHSNP